MKYLIISDTHKFLNNAVDLIEKLKPDYCIHLGDIAQDCDDLENIFPRQKFIFVKGNNDVWLRDNRFPDERCFELEGKRFFVCHGHKFHVKSSLDYLKSAAKEKKADIVLFGHTHKKYIDKSDTMVILNPGGYSSYGLITIENGIIAAIVKEYDKNEISQSENN